MRISDWSSDVCSSDLWCSSPRASPAARRCGQPARGGSVPAGVGDARRLQVDAEAADADAVHPAQVLLVDALADDGTRPGTASAAAGGLQGAAVVGAVGRQSVG